MIETMLFPGLNNLCRLACCIELEHHLYDIMQYYIRHFMTCSSPWHPCWQQIQIKLRWALLVTYTEYNDEWNVFSAFNPSKWSSGQPTLRRPGSKQSGVRCLAQGSHLSRGHFLPEPGFEPTTLGYKSKALSIRPQLPPQLELFRALIWGMGLNRQVIQDNPHILIAHITCPLLLNKDMAAKSMPPDW